VSRFLRDELAEQLAGKASQDLIFAAPAVLRGQRQSPTRYFDRATTAAGIEGVVPHELRHTAASLAIRSGANTKVVETMMGHASATMTGGPLRPPVR
jgi:integrase